MPLRVPLCRTCQTSSRRILPLTYQHRHVTVNVYSIGAYEGAIQKLILSKNYGQAYGAQALAQLLAAEHLDKIMDAQCIMPVPLHWSRKMWRGFNQSEIIARHLSRHSHVPVDTHMHRATKTPQLTRLSITERNAIMQNVFALPGNSLAHKVHYHGAHVVIVDDVYTTGTTVKSMITVLKKMGVRRVTVLVAARVLFDYGE